MKKKVLCLLMAAMLMVVLASTAFATSGKYEGYSDGVLSYSWSDAGEYIEITCNGQGLYAGPASAKSGKSKISLEPGKTYTITFSGDNGTDKVSFTVPGGETEPPVTEPPVTEPPVTEPPVTEPPVTEPPVTLAPTTEAPKTEAPKTEAPKTEAPKTTAPTKAPSTDNDDVPKTGDATTTFVFVIVAAMLLAAGALTAMRVYARKK